MKLLKHSRKWAAIGVLACLVVVLALWRVNAGSDARGGTLRRIVLDRIAGSSLDVTWWVWQDGGVAKRAQRSGGKARVTVFRCGLAVGTLDGEAWPMFDGDSLVPLQDPESAPMELKDVLTVARGHMRDMARYVAISERARKAMYGLVSGGVEPDGEALREICLAECYRIIRDSSALSRMQVGKQLGDIIACCSTLGAEERGDIMTLAREVQDGITLESEQPVIRGCDVSVATLLDHRNASFPTMHVGITDIDDSWEATLGDLRIPRACWPGLVDYWDSEIATMAIEQLGATFRFVQLGRVVRAYASMLAGRPLSSATEWLAFCGR